MPQKTLVEKITAWVGSGPSLILHTFLFATSFILAAIGKVSWDKMLLFVTTIVSLEAIYLSILIQMTVNRQSKELAEVSEDVEDIQEDIEEISHDVDEIQKDVDEIQEDVEEISGDDDSAEQQEQRQVMAIEQLSKDVQRLLADIEQLKKG